MAQRLLFHVLPSSGVPIYRQLVDQVRRHVALGRLRGGDFLPSVRQVALEIEVNPMTVSKAYSLLEREGLVELVRGQGMRVVERDGVADGVPLRQRQEQMMPLLRQAAAEAAQLGLSPKQVQILWNRVLKELTPS